MKISFKGLVAFVVSLGFTFSVYPILSNTHSQPHQPYAIANDPIGGGPREPISNNSTGVNSGLKNPDSAQANLPIN
ncbi:MAG: hypothetical protein ACK48D_02275 [Pseudanabaena sp.]|jgi:hypothetical protein